MMISISVSSWYSGINESFEQRVLYLTAMAKMAMVSQHLTAQCLFRRVDAQRKANAANVWSKRHAIGARAVVWVHNVTHITHIRHLLLEATHLLLVASCYY